MTLENLKKQAKTLLRQHRAGYLPVATRFRRSLSRLETMSDREIMNLRLALHDAQQVIASEYGCRDWAHLRKELPKMSPINQESVTSLAAPHLCLAQPQLRATDVARLAAFYRDQLGFKIEYLYGEPPFYGLVSRGGAHLNLRLLPDHVFSQPAIEEQQFLSAAIPTENVKSLFLEFESNDVPFFQTLKHQPWDADDFIVKDPDGNLICFASPT